MLELLHILAFCWCLFAIGWSPGCGCCGGGVDPSCQVCTENGGAPSSVDVTFSGVANGTDTTGCCNGWNTSFSLAMEPDPDGSRTINPFIGDVCSYVGFTELCGTRLEIQLFLGDALAPTTGICDIVIYNNTTWGANLTHWWRATVALSGTGTELVCDLTTSDFSVLSDNPLHQCVWTSASLDAFAFTL